MLDLFGCNLCFGQMDLSIKLITQYENHHQPEWKVILVNSIVSKRDVSTMSITPCAQVIVVLPEYLELCL
jgi:hypothetical protein